MYMMCLRRTCGVHTFRVLMVGLCWLAPQYDTWKRNTLQPWNTNHREGVFVRFQEHIRPIWAAVENHARGAVRAAEEEGPSRQKKAKPGPQRMYSPRYSYSTK